MTREIRTSMSIEIERPKANRAMRPARPRPTTHVNVTASPSKVAA
jgi:hypothetical protein